MKFLKRILLALAVLVAALIIIFNQQIPAFIYNEFEWQARARYLFAEEVQAQIDYLIDIRTGKAEGVFIPDEEKLRLWEDIEKGLNFKGELIDEYFVFVNRQEKIPFLPAKYKEYHELKKPGFENYQKALLIFREIKEKEHKAFRLTRQLDIAYTKFVGSGEDLSWEEHFRNIENAAGVAEHLISQAERLYKGNVIDEDFKSYIELQCNKIIDVYKVLIDPEYATDSEATAKEMEAISQRGSEVDFDEIVTNWHKNILDDPNKEMKDYDDLAYEQMMEADKYYRENDLKNDLISRLLSKFLKSYPKNI